MGMSPLAVESVEENLLWLFARLLVGLCHIDMHLWILPSYFFLFCSVGSLADLVLVVGRAVVA